MATTPTNFRYPIGAPMSLDSRQPVSLDAPDGPVVIRRNHDGIHEIRAAGLVGAAFGQGWSHGVDRQLQVLMTRCLLCGRAAEQLKGDPELVAIDTFMRRTDFLPDAPEQERALDPLVRPQLDAYAAGFNQGMARRGLVFELRLLGFRPEPWTAADTLRIGKAFGYIGLADAQGAVERLLLQMIQQGISDDQLRELFPYLSDPIDRDLLGRIRLAPPPVPPSVRWLSALPHFTASNNWAIAGRHTASGKALLCGDPHLEVNRLPNVFQEVAIDLPDNRLAGVSIPGVPGIVLGRTRHIAWSATYAFMDMIDLRIEHCRQGLYRRGEKWLPLAVREERIKIKGGGERTLRFFETEHGALEGNPGEGEGYFLVQSWSAARGCGAADLNALLALPAARGVEEAMALFRRIEASAFNYVIADNAGHIGYQMSGRAFRRPEGVSGLLPTPAWDPAFDARGYEDPADLPRQFDPPEGIIVTANQDLNHLGRARPITLAMGAYRAERIAELLKGKSALGVAEMPPIQFDLYSLQAERIMRLLRPLCPDTPNGRALREWDLIYDEGSRGAVLFEAVYAALLRTVFGDGGMGRETIDFLLRETGAFNEYYANFDAILLREDSAWYFGRSRGQCLRQALEEGLALAARPYGETRLFTLTHLLFGGKLPRFLGFDRGPLPLPGNRATVQQGQIFKSGGRTTSFSPVYRLIADMADGTLRTTLAGGPSDRRFSRWYASDLENWAAGRYKVL